MTAESGSGSVERVVYKDGQVLGVKEFDGEQLYHLTMRRRHNLTGHTWGIADGLAIDLEFKRDRLVVERGYAVDGFGREIVVVSPLEVPLPKRPGERFGCDLWLCYGEKTDGRCWRVEVPTLMYTDADLEKPPDPDRPSSMDECDLGFRPHRLTPHNRLWPVFLARVITERNGTTRAEIAHRRYIGVRGARITHPSDNVAVLLHDTAVGRRRFVVQRRPGGGDPWEALLVVDDDEVAVPGRLAVGGELQVGADGLRFTTAGSPKVAPGTAVVYRSEDGGYHDLRISVPAKGRLVIGAWSTDREEFVPCLTVSADRTVTVDGTLVVRGRMDGYAAGGDDLVDEPELPITIATMLAGRPGHLRAVVDVLKRKFPRAVDDLRKEVCDRPDSPEAIARRLGEEPELLLNVVRILGHEYPHVIEKLRNLVCRQPGPGS
ncbi:MAG: hypothetical protein HOV94_24045 [Saccharothrix sp.]|nr:hypothetical protein [Saccharothrix sp.]